MGFTYQPHVGQRTIHAARKYRFRTVVCGRRWGKTACAAGELIDCAIQLPGEYGWLAPEYLVADRGVIWCGQIAGDMLEIKGKAPVKGVLRGPRGTSVIYFLSADHPETGRNFGFRGMVVDEAARIPLKDWQSIYRPTLSDKRGWAMFITTPRGRNWIFDQYTRGLDPEDTSYKSFQFESRSNPYFPKEEWATAKMELPEDVFRQEYMAEFLEDSAGVFRGIDKCLFDKRPPVGKEPVVVGCDLAKYTDFTWLIAMGARSGVCLAQERFNQLDWPMQKERILDFCRRWPGQVVLDATGAGDPIYDDLRPYVPGIEAFKISAASKPPLIQRLAVAIEQQQISWPTSWEMLTAELKRYEYEFSPTGGVRYNAPAGYHDDGVIALALANHARWTAVSRPLGLMRSFARIPFRKDVRAVV